MTTPPLAQGGAARAPIACTLTPAEYRTRTTDLASLAARALLRRDALAEGERLTFRGDAGVEQELHAVMAAEAACCAFLAMDLRRQDDTLVLDVTAPDEARQLVAELFA